MRHKKLPSICCEGARYYQFGILPPNSLNFGLIKISLLFFLKPHIYIIYKDENKSFYPKFLKIAFENTQTWPIETHHHVYLFSQYYRYVWYVTELNKYKITPHQEEKSDFDFLSSRVGGHYRSYWIYSKYLKEFFKSWNKIN